MRKTIVAAVTLLALTLFEAGTVRASVGPTGATVPPSMTTVVTTSTTEPPTTTTTTEPALPETATITISPTTVHPGESFEARGTCDPPAGFESVVFLGKVFFNIEPAPAITVSVPTDTPPGRYSVEWDCMSTMRDPPFATAQTTVTVAAAPPASTAPSKLPATS